MRIRSLATVVAASALVAATAAVPASAVPSETPTAPTAPTAPSAQRLSGVQLSWAMVKSRYPKQVFYNRRTQARVGYRNGGVIRSYFTMSLHSAAYQDHVRSVKFVMKSWILSQCRKGGAQAITVSQTHGFGKKTTWKNQPKTIRKIATVKPTCTAEGLKLNITKAVRKVLRNGGEKITLRLSAANEKSRKGFVQFNPAARLIIAGPDGTPGAVQNPSFTAADGQPVPCGRGAGRPTITVPTGTFAGTVANADGYVGLSAQLKKITDTGSEGFGYVSSGMMFVKPNQPQLLTVSAGADVFRDGSVYSWRLVGNGAFTSGPWTDWCEFKVDLPATGA